MNVTLTLSFKLISF